MLKTNIFPFLFATLLFTNNLIGIETQKTSKFDISISVKKDSLKEVLIQKHHDFEYIIRPNSKRWRKIQDGTFSDYGSDRGHINSLGQKTGTNRSVASKTAEKYYKRVVSRTDMLSLSYEDAIKIYENIWVGNMLGHKMKCHNPILLDLIFNSICSRPARAYSDFAEVIEEITCISLPKNQITNAHIELFNDICRDVRIEEEFYLSYLKKRTNFCIAASKKSNQAGMKKWAKDYPQDAYK